MVMASSNASLAYFAMVSVYRPVYFTFGADSEALFQQLFLCIGRVQIAKVQVDFGQRYIARVGQARPQVTDHADESEKREQQAVQDAPVGVVHERHDENEYDNEVGIE